MAVNPGMPQQQQWIAQGWNVPMPKPAAPIVPWQPSVAGNFSFDYRPHQVPQPTNQYAYPVQQQQQQQPVSVQQQYQYQYNASGSAPKRARSASVSSTGSRGRGRTRAQKPYKNTAVSKARKYDNRPHPRDYYHNIDTHAPIKPPQQVSKTGSSAAPADGAVLKNLTDTLNELSELASSLASETQPPTSILSTAATTNASTNAAPVPKQASIASTPTVPAASKTKADEQVISFSFQPAEPAPRQSAPVVSRYQEEHRRRRNGSLKTTLNDNCGRLVELSEREVELLKSVQDIQKKIQANLQLLAKMQEMLKENQTERVLLTSQIRQLASELSIPIVHEPVTLDDEEQTDHEEGENGEKSEDLEDMAADASGEESDHPEVEVTELKDGEAGERVDIKVEEEFIRLPEKEDDAASTESGELSS